MPKLWKTMWVLSLLLRELRIPHVILSRMEKLPHLQEGTYSKDKQKKKLVLLYFTSECPLNTILEYVLQESFNFSQYGNSKRDRFAKAFWPADVNLPSKPEKDPATILRKMCKKLVSQQSRGMYLQFHWCVMQLYGLLDADHIIVGECLAEITTLVSPRGFS